MNLIGSAVIYDNQRGWVIDHIYDDGRVQICSDIEKVCIVVYNHQIGFG